VCWKTTTDKHDKIKTFYKKVFKVPVDQPDDNRCVSSFSLGMWNMWNYVCKRNHYVKVEYLYQYKYKMRLRLKEGESVVK
jgi:predicted enzyme related to lactoylglutathione lyase